MFPYTFILIHFKHFDVDQKKKKKFMDFYITFYIKEITLFP